MVMMLGVWATIWGHVGIQWPQCYGVMLVWVACNTTWDYGDMSIVPWSMVLPQSGSVFMSVVYGDIKGHIDAWDLGCNL